MTRQQQIERSCCNAFQGETVRVEHVDETRMRFAGARTPLHALAQQKQRRTNRDDKYLRFELLGAHTALSFRAKNHNENGFGYKK